MPRPRPWRLQTAITCAAMAALPATAACDVAAGPAPVDGDWARVQVQPAPSQLPRTNHSLIYDAVGDRFIVFGGQGQDGNSSALCFSDVWAIPAGTPAWSPLIPSGDPLPRRTAHAAVYDPPGRRMIVFGGQTDGSDYNDVWSIGLEGAPVATRLHPTGTPPPPRMACSAIYDSARTRMIVFGGAHDGLTTYYDDVWALSLSGELRWTRLQPTGVAPRSRFFHSAIYDPVRDRMVVYGGMDSTRALLGDLWGLSLSDPPRWSSITGVGTPPARRREMGAVYDPRRDRLVIYGGIADPGTGGTVNEEVWGFPLGTGGTWQESFPSNVSSELRRSGAGVCYDPLRDRMMVVGGWSNASRFSNDVWALPLDAALRWDRLVNGVSRPIVSPVFPAGKFTAVFDTRRQRVVVIGAPSTVYLADVWSAGTSDTSVWLHLEPTNAPPAASYDAGALYDSLFDRVLVFGGTNASNPHSILSFSLSTHRWDVFLNHSTIVDLNPTLSTVVLDRARRRVLVFGGCCPRISATWAIGMEAVHGYVTTAVRLAVTGTPPSPRNGSAVVLDPLSDRLVVHGGLDDTHTLDDTWALTLDSSPTWSPLTPTPDPGSGAPLLTAGQPPVFDPRRDRAILTPSWSIAFGAAPGWDALTTTGPSPPLPLTNLSVDVPRDRALTVTAGAGSSAPVDVWLWSFPAPFSRSVTVAGTHASPGGVEIEWTTNDPEGAVATVYRSVAGGSWIPLGTEEVRATGAVTFVDATTVPGTRYAYRLGFTDGTVETYWGEVWVDAPARLEFSLAGLRPNPATDVLELTFGPPTSDRATLELLDVSGRLVLRRDITGLTPGEHTLRLDATPPAGVYFLRLTQQGRSAVARCAVVR